LKKVGLKNLEGKGGRRYGPWKKISKLLEQFAYLARYGKNGRVPFVKVFSVS
jgi:hypothetical protein